MSTHRVPAPILMPVSAARSCAMARRMLVALPTVAAALLTATPSAAAGYATRDVGDWVVSASSDGQGCFITRTYPNPRATTVQFGLDVDGSNRLTLLNANWSIKDREPLKLTFRLSKASFPRHAAIGIVADGKRGFVSSFGASFARDLAASRTLQVRRGEVIVEDLALDGSGAAIAEMRSCVDRFRDAPKAARAPETGSDGIPLDPFAAQPRRESRK